MAWSDNAISSYTGIDIVEHPNWKVLLAKHTYLGFLTSKAEDLRGHFPDRTNFIISQSAIEHFDHDLTYFLQIRDYIHHCQHTVIQIHLIPSRACLRLYRFHGARQYTPRTVSRITRFFKEFSYAILFRLGGMACNDLHYEFITQYSKRKMKDLRDLKPEEYDHRLFEAIENDMKISQTDPAFYALLIHSNWKRKLF